MSYPTNYDNTVNAKKLGLPQMRADVAQSVADVAALNTRVTTAEGAITQNTADISQNASDISSLGGRVSTAEDDIDALETTVAAIPVVQANPTGTATETLTTLSIDNTIYDIPQGGGGGSSVVTVVYEANVEVGDINYSNFLSDLSGYRLYSESTFPASISPDTQYNIVLMANEDEGHTRLVFPAFTFVDNSSGGTHYLAFLTGDPNTPVVFAKSTRLTDQEPT